jgi:MSHA biogenesis protein MshM
MLAYGQGKQQVSAGHVAAAASDTLPARRRVWPWFAGASTLAAAAGLTWAFIR